MTTTERGKLLDGLKFLSVSKLRERVTIARVHFGKDSTEHKTIQAELKKRVQQNQDEAQKQREARKEERWRLLMDTAVPFGDSQELFRFNFDGHEWRFLQAHFCGIVKPPSAFNFIDDSGTETVVSKKQPCMKFHANDGQLIFEPVPDPRWYEDGPLTLPWNATPWQEDIDNAFIYACSCRVRRYMSMAPNFELGRSLLRLYSRVKSASLPGFGVEAKKILAASESIDSSMHEVKKAMEAVVSILSVLSGNGAIGQSN